MSRFRVVDLKQYHYCPRIIYYHHCLPHIRPTTYKMEAGIAAQNEEEARAARRSLRAYGLTRGECMINVPLSSETLGLRGEVDLVIKTDDNSAGMAELIPVDYKLSAGRLGDHFKLQLLAYALLLEEKEGIPAQRGFLYAIPKRRAEEVQFTPTLRRKLSKALVEMAKIVTHEQIPEPTKQRAKCQACEFRRFCNDV